GGMGARQMGAVEVHPLVVDLVVGGVQVLRAASAALRSVRDLPRTEPQHAPAHVGKRKHDPSPEAVICAAAGLARALGKTGLKQLLLAEAGAAGCEQYLVPGARRVADAEILQRLLGEPPAEQ